MEQGSLSEEARAKAERAYALATEYERKYGSCPQCVLQAIHETVMPIGDELFKASHVLAGGGALGGSGTCGALVGGLLAISSRHGRDRERFTKGRHLLSFQKGKVLFDRFMAEFGTATCVGVQMKMAGRTFDLWDKADYAAFDAAGHREQCPPLAGVVARWTAELLLADMEKEQTQGG